MQTVTEGGKGSAFFAEPLNPIQIEMSSMCELSLTIGIDSDE